MEFVEQVTTADGTRYVVRVYGQPRTDGTWVGWLEFVAVGAAIVLRRHRDDPVRPRRPRLLGERTGTDIFGRSLCTAIQPRPGKRDGEVYEHRNQWWNPLKRCTGSNLADVSRDAVRRFFACRGDRLRRRRR
jgi:hypothetical protein